MSQEGAVILTNDDSTSCKRAAVQLGYWKDDFIKAVCPHAERRAPIIHRGYYARTVTFARVVEDFLKKSEGKGQVLSLGAGFDTLFWRLLQKGTPFRSFVEVDYAEVVQRKTEYIQSKRVLHDLWKPNQDRYHMLAQDIRKPTELLQKLTEKGVDFSAPTICISECVLVYLPPEDTRGLLQALASAFTEMFYLNYEQINPHDSFGKMMLRNLRTRGCALLGLEACPDLAAQKQRFLAAGFGQADALDMNGVYLRLEEDDRKRIERIEMLDEMEEWQLICAHYCISWAAKGPAVEAMQCRV
eukprot:m.151577 g.151577  ORF g.151577 m.151577 type:complete len:300 (+) comp20701_c0_seq5:3063-3962(+)